MKRGIPSEEQSFRRLTWMALAVCLTVGLVAIGAHLKARASGPQKGVIGGGLRANIQVMLDSAKAIDLSSTGNLGVAVLGSPSLDVTAIDPRTITFAGAAVMKLAAADAPPSAAGNNDVRGPQLPTANVAYKDVNGDGRDDLIAYFSVPFLAHLSAGFQEAFLQARTFGGAAIEGSQFVQATGAPAVSAPNAPEGTEFCNGNPIIINDNAPASPYPSTINVTGLTGVTTEVQVTLHSFSHTYSRDVSILLVSPTGQKVILVSQAGPSSNGIIALNAELTFSDMAMAYLPRNGGIVSGVYKPSNYAGNNAFGDVFFPAPAPPSTPASPYASTLSAFNGQNPNGTWSLYVVDNATGDTGQINNGWCINITTGQSATGCSSTLLQGSITAADATEAGRLNRDGVPSLCSDAPKSCPGIIGSATTHYDAYTLTNQSGAPACVTVTTTSSCGSGVFTTAYLNSFTPPPPAANICVNYLADAGNSPEDLSGVGGPFSFNVPAGATFVLVVNETTAGAGCSAYSLLVEGNICSGSSGCTITCPANITVSNNPIQCGVVVSYPAPTTTGACGAVTCSPASGSFFPNGTTTVTCSEPGGAHCSFTVTVTGSCSGCTLTCPSNITVSNNPNQCGVVVSYPAPTTSGTCGTVTCSPASGSFFPNGTTTVTCSEPGGANCSFTVTVTGNCFVCTLTCPANITKANDPNQCGAITTYSQPLIGGFCSPGPVNCSPASGSFFPKGTTTVSCTLVGSSPTVSCSFTVTVNDTQPPTITCPASATGGTTVTYPPPTVSDNCPGVTVQCTPPSGSALPAGATTVTCTATDTSGNTASCSFPIVAFDGRLQDDAEGCNNSVLFNTTTGDYRWCCHGTTFTGRAKVSHSGNTVTLVHNATDRRVQIIVNFGAPTPNGNASLQAPPGTIRCTIADRDIRNDTCLCGGTPTAANR